MTSKVLYATPELRHVSRGFATPDTDSQRMFRALMQALSFPGRITRLAPEGLDAPIGLEPAMAALLIALPNTQTPVWLLGFNH